MKLLFIDKAGDGGLDIALRAIACGHAVKYFLQAFDRDKRPVGRGLVDLVPDWRAWFAWADMVILTQCDYAMQEIDRYRERYGVPVIGGSAESAKWENDRLHGMKVFRQAGIPIPPVREFTDYDSAIRHVESAGEPLFSKPCWDGADKSLSCQTGTASDPAWMLKRWKKRQGRPKGTFILQERIEGIEFAVGAWFGPGGFARGWEENWETKKLFPGDLGPATGEMGTTMRLVAKSKMADKVLRSLEDQLDRLGYVGNVDVNCIVDEDGTPWPLEFTMRCGWPSTNIEAALHEDMVEWLYGLATGKPPDTRRLDTAAVGVVLAIPPFPHSVRDYDEVVGLPIHVRRHAAEWHPAEVMAAGDAQATAGDYVGIATGTGASVKEAAERAYRTIRAVEIPGGAFWRNDIGLRLRKQLPLLQEHGYAAGLNYAAEAAGKISKAEAGYVDEAQGERRCGGCSMFRQPGSCTLVNGVISPRGWCRHWAPG